MIVEIPSYQACAAVGTHIFLLKTDNLISLPKTSEIFVLPDRTPIGYSPETNSFEKITGYNAVSVFLPPGYIRLYNPAYIENKGASILPLFAYSPLVWFKGAFHTPATRIDKRKVHDHTSISMNRIHKNISLFSKSKNRLIHHLANCALTYKCPNALNLFSNRYEGPLPTSPSCNAKCLGCISYQPKDSCPSTQNRINFIPTPEEIAETALYHIKNVRHPIVSFGQGCEGEPLLQTKIIADAIKLIRQETRKGTINMNTNGSLPRNVELLCKAGMDSFRISLNSVREIFYNKYYRPLGYTFTDIIESIKVAKQYEKFVSLNYLVMPGFTDEKDEYDALLKFVQKTKIDMIQWRNLNYDPFRYFKSLGIEGTKNILGIKTIITSLKKISPKLGHGYFNIYLNL